MIFRDLIDRRAESDPTGAAIADSTRTYDNSEFADAIRATQAHLVAAGVAPGDVVAVALTNRVEFVTILFAAWRLGATVTPINPASTPTELARQVADSAAVLTVVEDTADPSDASVRVSDVTGPSSGPVPGVYDGPAAPALLIYTSGSTGTPKGVVLGHDNIEAMTSMGIEGLHLTSDDACLLILPLFHVNGIVVSVLCPLRAGARVVVADRFDPRTFFDIVDEHRPTYFSAVPTIVTMLTALPDDVSPDTSSLRFVVCGAAPASAELLRAFESRYGTIVLEGYGLSEGTCASTLNPLDGVRKPGTVGLPFPGQEIRIVAADGTVAAEGEPGEVCIRGANVMAGYLGRDEDTARTVVDGWLHTGDVGTLDSDGYLTIVGRTKEMIIRGGENIYPREIEDVLSLDPAVLESAVIGVPDDKWGESVVAFVSSRAGHTVDTERLDALCRDRLSRFKWPTTITVVDALPKNAVGKLDRRALSDF